MPAFAAELCSDTILEAQAAKDLLRKKRIWKFVPGHAALRGCKHGKLEQSLCQGSRGVHAASLCAAFDCLIKAAQLLCPPKLLWAHLDR